MLLVLMLCLLLLSYGLGRLDGWHSFARRLRQSELQVVDAQTLIDHILAEQSSSR